MSGAPKDDGGAAESIELVFGAVCPSIAEQLAGVDHGIDPTALGHAQFDADAITRLVVRGLIPDSAAHSARKKLLKRITGWISIYRRKQMEAAA